MPRVLNKYLNGVPEGAVYIGRGSKWGNPFPITPSHDRSQVIEAYIHRSKGIPNFVEDVKRELRGKDLVCFCSPKPCHGDFLLRIANAPD